jgi:ribosomal protein L11 methylase PrmA
MNTEYNYDYQIDVRFGLWLKTTMNLIGIQFYDLANRTQISSGRLIELAFGSGYGVTNSECRKLAKALKVPLQEVLDIAAGKLN